MDWIDLDQNRDTWLALVNAVWAYGFHKIWEISWLAEDLFPTQEELCSTELVS